MDQVSVESGLSDLHLPFIRYYPIVDSTNDEAWRWVERGAPHAALVIADEQTAGRGRLKRRWVTIPHAGLAFSLVLRNISSEPMSLNRLTGLGALSTCQALANLYSLPAMVKWPNDILLEQRKAGGVLVEARWNGDELSAVVIGIGINIAPESISPQHLPAARLTIPAACVEDVLGRAVDRLELLHGILQEFFRWLPRLASLEFIHTWESCLAYRGQWVEFTRGVELSTDVHSQARPLATTGKVVGLNQDGSLRLLTGSGELESAQAGEIHLRPVPPPPG
jgi:BirA family biotin operon repressor/biotin-[acetyl-CoA-carboxylase] ligase